jgi:hypothetical protein
MSVLSNSTHFNISNTGNKFLELSLSADQSSSFRIRHKSPHIYETPRTNVDHASYMSWLVHGATSVLHGSSMEYVKINLPVNETVECEISCKSALIFETSIRDRTSRDHNKGEMIIPPETQGCELHIIFKEQKGLAYTSNGNVALGVRDMQSQTIVVSSTIKTMDGHVIDIEDNSPAMCKSSI